MNHKHIAAYGFIATVIGIFTLAFFSSVIDPQVEAAFTSFGGLLILIFGIWQSVLLLKKD